MISRLHPNDRPLYGTFRDDEAPSVTEPWGDDLDDTDAPDHAPGSPLAESGDRGASSPVPS